MTVFKFYAFACCLLVIGGLSFLARHGYRPSLPPGPQPKFFSGNVHQLPMSEPWKVFASWAKQYSSCIIYYRIFSRQYIVLDTVDAGHALLEGRSAIYSDRPDVYMADVLASRKMSVFTVSSQSPPGRHRMYRKLLHTGLNPRAINMYHPLLRREVCILLQRLRDSPDGFLKHFKRNVGANILEMTFGWTVRSDDDYFVSLMEEIFRIHRPLIQPGRWLVEVFPILRFVPAWMPGAYFKRFARATGIRLKEIDNVYLWVKEQMAAGQYIESFTSQHLLQSDGQNVSEEEEDLVKWCAAAMYVGGVDTSASVLSSFALLMMRNPEVQKRARIELRNVIGQPRLVRADEKGQLPYIEAVVKEVLRLAPPARLGLPHRVIEDDSYLGYRIPKGTTVMANIWSICRDPSVYSNPDKFDPDRFLNLKELDPRKIVFGYGRRVCPGAHFAEDTLFVDIANILQFFDIKKPLDTNGVEIDPEIVYNTGIINHPSPFSCRIIACVQPEVLSTVLTEAS